MHAILQVTLNASFHSGTTTKDVEIAPRRRELSTEKTASNIISSVAIRQNLLLRCKLGCSQAPNIPDLVAFTAASGSQLGPKDRTILLIIIATTTTLIDPNGNSPGMIQMTTGTSKQTRNPKIARATKSQL